MDKRCSTIFLVPLLEVWLRSYCIRNGGSLNMRRRSVTMSMKAASVMKLRAEWLSSLIGIMGKLRVSDQ